MDDTNTAKQRLPDFIFGRRLDIEREGNFAIVGILVTDIPLGRQIRGGDRKMIQQIITRLTQLVEREPELVVAGIWRTGTKPADGLSPPFDDRLLKDRSERCLCIMITAGTCSMVSVPSDLVRQIMGGVVH